MSRVFMGRLPMDTRESDVERFMRGYGHIRDITLKKGYGFVVSLLKVFLFRLAPFQTKKLLAFYRNLTTTGMQKTLLMILMARSCSEKGLCVILLSHFVKCRGIIFEQMASLYF